MGLDRSEQMARIRGRHTTPERSLRAALWEAGLRYRLHVAAIPGRPDVVFGSRKVAIFIDGCFWHGCPRHYVLPRTRREFWTDKLASNVDRDRRQTVSLRAMGWTVLRFWEHDVYERLDRVVETISSVVRGERAPALRLDWRVVDVEIIDAEADIERRHLVTLLPPVRRRKEVRKRTTAKAVPPRAKASRRPSPSRR